MLRRGKLFLIAAILAVVPMLAFAPPAQAATDRVDGADAVTDDWGDNFNELGHSLCNGCADSGNTDLVVMWQAVLFAEGYLSAGGIDGAFGPNTDAATERWQARYNELPAGNIAVDGWVGDQTWGAADNRLRLERVPTDPPFYRVVYDTMNGSGSVRFIRGSSNNPDGGNYDMNTACRSNGTCVTFSGSQIFFYSRTISVN